jgi:glycosyltransferase involved in cell wall biosynthesis
MKLVILGEISSNKKSFLEEINAYRFKDDVVLHSHHFEEDEIVASAYAGIVFTNSNNNPESLIHLLSCRIPPVAADHLIHREIVEDAGIYFQGDNLSDLAAQMMHMYKDEDLRNRLINLAKARTDLFTMENAVQHLEQSILKFTQHE